MFIAQSAEGHQGLTIRVFHSLRYVDEFLRLRCAPDLLAAQPGKWDAKEISESVAAKHAIKRALGLAVFASEDVVLLDVGSGAAARTALLLAHLTPWVCAAIDPVLKDRQPPAGVDRLVYFPDRIENFALYSSKHVIAVCVHAHCKLDYIVQNVSAPQITVIAIPCCEPLVITGLEPDVEYMDRHVLSPHRTVKIWRNACPQDTTNHPLSPK